MHSHEAPTTETNVNIVVFIKSEYPCLASFLDSTLTQNKTAITQNEIQPTLIVFCAVSMNVLREKSRSFLHH